MANTYVLIASNTLGSSAASVTFSSIPATYTDLVLRVSSRGTTAQVDGFTTLEFNGSGGTAYSNTYLYGGAGGGTLVGSSFSANQAKITDLIGQVYANATSNTFGSQEIYIPSYTASQNKPLSHFGVPETNAAGMDNGRGITAGLWRNTAAITSMVIAPASGSFVSGSSFFLYGIKNS